MSSNSSSRVCGGMVCGGRVCGGWVCGGRVCGGRRRVTVSMLPPAYYLQRYDLGSSPLPVWLECHIGSRARLLQPRKKMASAMRSRPVLVSMLPPACYRQRYRQGVMGGSVTFWDLCLQVVLQRSIKVLGFMSSNSSSKIH